jgi:hypothetical protein
MHDDHHSMTNIQIKTRLAVCIVIMQRYNVVTCVATKYTDQSFLVTCCNITAVPYCHIVVIKISVTTLQHYNSVTKS